MICLRQFTVDGHFLLREKSLEKCIQPHREQGFILFFVNDFFYTESILYKIRFWIQ
jgi:hypothetical protein